MRAAHVPIIGALTACLLGFPAAPGARVAAPAFAARDLLRDIAQFSDAEWAAVERGESVARLLDTESREIAVVGAVRVDGSLDVLLDRIRDIENLRRSQIVIDAGRFGQVPRPSDLERLPLEERSLDLRSCREGDCQVRLNASDVARFQREVNWNAPDWREKSAGLWREVLASYAARYQQQGRRALPEYVNKAQTLSVASELGLLLREYGFIATYSRELHDYLQEFGPRAPAGSLQTLYWSKEDFGVRPVLRISHQVVYRNGRSAFVVTNQVYADHYLDAALSLTAGLEAGQSERGFYLVSVNRARSRSLSGFFRRFVRSTVQSRSREAMRKVLNSTRNAIESHGKASSGAYR
jgi:hypothetical protein